MKKEALKYKEAKANRNKLVSKLQVLKQELLEKEENINKE